MNKKIVIFLILIASIQNALADDVFMATSEDLKEFDKILSEANKNAVKSALPPIPSKQTKPINPRERFQNENKKNPNYKNMRPPRPFDQRPAPGGNGPGAPPPPPPQNGPPPPPP